MVLEHLMDMPHFPCHTQQGTLNIDHLVFLRSKDEYSPWEVLQATGSLDDGLGKLEVTSFSFFGIVLLFGYNGPERVMCRP